ncbi:formate-dependent phosphoribosylglycinamide formyltransferase [Leptospira interrogans]|uniref:Formate-dependent phosphoribosylglycinamide formyltransferase n=1 Tax=Leptospira interrogans serovar Lora str. TE 1992 TaxID=1193028 RepID=M3F1B7_LEPIR|nr:formate-dependent phosphoribosylglycinamide formyltransferase [Leptospira interrogans]EMF43891.1 phosphoribosylglycinamide formyltransferase 2 [Leptospira interrogans serovar Lora str. TE 1992]AKH78763.1 phosphoribosylglycinamide formyltransferase [Leptospira interrogans serovar Bratislava]EMJ52313.1 phosphoribosylglycinamide formyltransferase 2 [Leptospira interrogans str. UT126]EMN09410.1 phosphoribosylglycinamide formyltransferase 2 [Leptospira interrogans serovar Muenchen str. Brem 129]
MKKKILLLGSGELGKEFVIAAQRLGQYVIAVDSYDDAPAMQVAHEKEIINMLDGNLLDQIIAKHKPDLIVPEIEAIKTERFYEYEKQGYQVVPSAKAANFTMNRKSIRDLAAKDLKLLTAKYAYASSIDELIKATEILDFPCVVKPLMSSSGKGQSVIQSREEISKAWEASQTKGRAGAAEIIVEEFIPFESEITLLTVTQKNGKTLFCPPIGHRQERGDYQESWQPAAISEVQLKEAQRMADAVTKELTGFGIWGVEFFLTEDKVYFSELSPRPHDTGMVTLAGTQNFNEFELHLRAILGIPILEITLERKGASAVILASTENKTPEISGLDIASGMSESDFRIFGKPITRPYRRMGVTLSYSTKGEEISSLRKRAVLLASKIKVD